MTGFADSVHARERTKVRAFVGAAQDDKLSQQSLSDHPQAYVPVARLRPKKAAA